MKTGRLHSWPTYPTKENLMLKNLVKRRELINSQIEDLLLDLISIEELIEMMLKENITKEEAIDRMRLNAQGA